MQNTMVRSALVLVCIFSGAALTFFVLTLVFDGEKAQKDSLTHDEKLDQLFEEPGKPPAKVSSNSATGNHLAVTSLQPAAVRSTNSMPWAGQGRLMTVAARSGAEGPPPAYAVQRWWGKEPAPSGFGIRHVGAHADKQAIGILFDGAVDSETLAQHITIRDRRGGTVTAQWHTAEANARFAAAPVPEAGRYTLIIDGRLTDVRGRGLGRNMHGPIFVP